MQPLSWNRVSTALVLFMFVVTVSVVPSVYLMSDPIESVNPSITQNDGLDSLHLLDEPQSEVSIFSIAETNTGILNPVLIEQVGYTTSGTMSARTDNNYNTIYSIYLDDTHDWLGSRAVLNISDLTRLYVLNGTFSTGTEAGDTINPSGTADYYPYGWTADSSSGDLDQIQRVRYENTDREYILVENEADLTNNPQHEYTHYSGTTVYWDQSIDLDTTTSDFLLSFDYYYANGPIDGSGPDSFSGNCFVEVIVDGTVVHSISLKDLDQRNHWYNVSDISISSSSSGPLDFKIGLNINSTFMLDADDDYDYTTGADGSTNAEFITVYFDDVSFTAANPPDFENVDLQYVVEGTSTPIMGSNGLGSASILKSDYWTTDPVQMQITSNTTVSFEYGTSLRSHRFSNSTWTTQNAKEGAQYSVSLGLSPQIQFHTYIGFLGDYENLTTRLWFLPDWENVTVFDPFLLDVTSSCTISGNMVEIPTSLMSRLGWWSANLEAPNYLKSLDIEKLNSTTETWTSESVYRSGNTTRAVIEIGTPSEIPSQIDLVNVTWMLPNATLWANESISDGIGGFLNSSSHIFGPLNASVGLWSTYVSWQNGTEVAFGATTFEVHHSANLFAEPSIIETATGLVVTGIVRYMDGETGTYIMDESAIVSCNWSLSTIYFDANPVKNWWEVSLDTKDIGAGNFTIHVDASRPYYDAASCDFLIVSTYVTRLNSPNNPWSSALWGSEISLVFNFEAYDAGADTWDPVINSSDVSVVVNWTTGYWSVTEDTTPGIYLVNLNTSALPAGTYLLDATFKKPNHESSELFLLLIVSPIVGSLIVLGYTSARANITDNYTLKLQYVDQYEDPISPASITVDSITPPIGLLHTTIEEVSGEPGNYSLILTPEAAGLFTVRFVATDGHSEPVSAVFVLAVNDVETILVVQGGNSFEIGLTDVFNTTFSYKTVNEVGVENASVSIIYSGISGGISWNIIEKGSGNYSVEFSATLSGTYVVTIAAFKQYYQSASDSFFLVVRDITTNFTVINGTAGIVSYGQDYRMVLSYTNGSDFGLEGADISIESVVPASGLSWGSTLPENPGVYSILLTPTIVNTFTILIKASLLNHQVQFVRFTITATAIATSLTVLNSSTTIAFDQNYTVFVYYQSEDLTGLDNANVTIQNPPTEVSFTAFEDIGDGYYRVTLIPNTIGIFDLVFRAALIGYQSDTAGFALSASRIQTNLRISNGLSSDTIEYLQTSEIDIVFERSDFNQTISGAFISLLASPTTGLDWYYYEESGAYHIRVEPGHIGRWTLTIGASKTGYALGSVQFILDVEPIRVEAHLLTLPSAIEGVEFPIEVSLTHEGTSIPVTGALVEFRMTAAGEPLGTYQMMTETDTPGIYRVTYTFPLYLSTGEYALEIRMNKDNYEMSGGPFTSPFSKYDDTVLRMVPVATGSSLLLVGLIGSVIGLRVMNTRKRRRNLEALQVKTRFDDVSNILGIITLHKMSGLPIYSKILRGGIESAMVSAFVTAITHFRSEFEMDEKQLEFHVVPISDIISAVPTRSLIVAFITVHPPSKYQESAMEAFGRATGALYDEILADTKVGFVDPSQTEIFDNLFNDLLDGILIERFRTSKDVSFPKSMRCLEMAVHQIENGEGFKLEDLAKGMATCGIEESHAYKIVMDAIDENLIEVAPETDSETIPPSPSENAIPEFDESDEFST